MHTELSGSGENAMRLEEQRVLATYRIETPTEIEYAAEMLAGEQSSGTFVKVPGETEELTARHRARIERITPLEVSDTPSLSGARPRKGSVGPVQYRRAEIEVSFPLVNMGANLPTLLATVAGNLYELGEFSGVKLLNLDLPPAFGESHPHPQFGVEGTRRLTGVTDRPIVGTIIKPSVGLTPEQTADLVKQLADADIDFIKDDELMADPPHSPLADRVVAVMRVLNDHADRTGKKVMYAFNITDDLDKMRRHHDTVLEAGGTCIMVSLNYVGVTGLMALRRHSQLPIHGHRNGWGMLTRHPYLGIEFPAYQQIWRLAGADHLHVNGLDNKFWEPNDSVVRSIEACLKPLLSGQPVVPVISSGQWGGQAPETYQRTQTIDVMYLAGGGIMAHPGGPGAGVRALRQCWEAAVQGIPLEKYAETHNELRQSIEKFGGGR
ncbi:MAG: ribulose-bisphosphate carboxylase large subunit family protein [Armatimonadaceae bacterium]